MDTYSGEQDPASTEWPKMPRKITERKIDTRWFQHQIEDKGLSQRQLAKRMRLDPSSVSLMLRGKRHMKVQEAALIAELLGLPLMDVMAKAGISSAEAKSATSGMIPVVGHVTEKSVAVIVGNHAQAPLVPAPPDAGGGTVALRYQTALTQLDAVDGWVIYFRPIEGVPAEAVGRLCVVREVGADHPRVGFVRRGYEPGEYSLLPYLGAEPEAVRLESASPVLWIRP